MTAFWKNLQQLAHGQLFHGGYLSPDVARTQAESHGLTRESHRGSSSSAGPAPSRFR
jgi:hypothetical protein